MHTNIIIACVVFAGYGGCVQVADAAAFVQRAPEKRIERLNCEAVLPTEPEEKRRYPRKVRRNKDGRLMVVPSKSSLKKRNQKR